MNTRRSFLRSLVAAVILAPAVCRVASELAAKLPERWKINPEWVTAQYEETLIFHKDGLSHSPANITEPNPRRFKMDGGEWVEVPHLI